MIFFLQFKTGNLFGKKKPSDDYDHYLQHHLSSELANTETTHSLIKHNDDDDDNWRHKFQSSLEKKIYFLLPLVRLVIISDSN